VTTTDYYELLGVPRQATEDEIKKAYRALAREHHPDANGGDAASEAKFKEITVAYETLRDPERRRKYDMFGPEGQQGGVANGSFFGGAQGFGDIFEAFFGQAGGFRATQGGRRGEDAEVTVNIPFDKAVFGGDVDVPIEVPLPCTACSGSGARPGTTPTTCPDCNGAGAVRRVRQSFLGQMMATVACPRCRGAGEVVSSPCTECRGQGRRTERRKISVRVPAGVDNEATLRVTGAGPAAVRGGEPGDLYVHLRVVPDKRFERARDDLVAKLHIPMTAAAFGCELEFETLDGPELVKIPPGTQSGKLVRIRGRGVPSLQGRGRGDLVLQVFVDTPSRLSKEEEELLRRFAEMRGEQVNPADPGLLSRLRSSFG
jgi:molecular chaperone DnaJ